MTDSPANQLANSSAARTVSWAQNHEDIVLARGLTGLGGFYVDIGAFDPELESVTKLFYERGWRGINVDPIATFIDRFELERPRDINICAAVSDHDGEMEIWVSPAEVPGHSTLDAGIAEAHHADGQQFVPKRVRSLRLDTLLTTFVPPGQSIDFLKVDVEGAEAAVLASWNSHQHRPRVIVVEAMAPHIDGSTHETWEHHLIEGGYALVLFDGLNRFYVAEDDTVLAAKLSAPANVLDDFESVVHRDLRQFCQVQNDELAHWKEVGRAFRERTAWLEARLAEEDQRLDQTA